MRQEKTLKPVANFYGKFIPSQMTSCVVNQLCELTAMQGSEKAVCWACQDFSEEAEGVFDKLAARFNQVEQCKQFKESLEAAKKFNALAKEGKDDELVWAPLVEDIDEPVVDDIDTNKTADADGDAD